MATINPKHEKCEENEIFVGNIPAGDNLTDLGGIKYRIGNIAYDIHGKEIASNYMLPLFIKKEDYDKYDALMMAQLRAIRNGNY